MIPSALEHIQEIGRRGDRLAVFLDYDGTLAPIVSHPEDASLSDSMRQTLRSLAALAKLRERRATTGTTALLTCSGVDVAYDSVQVLFNVDFEVEPGEIVALLGTNGAGKSTLLKAVSGLQPPLAGSIVFDGRDVTHLDAKAKFEAGIVQMPGGVPVATLAIGTAGAKNAGLLAVAILSAKRPPLRRKLKDFREQQTRKVLDDTLA